MTALMALVVAFGASFPPARAAAEAPTAAQILDAYVAATGGLAVYDKEMNSVSKAILDIPAAGIKIDVTVYAARPNQLRSTAQAPALGSIDRGTDGTIFWERSTMQGPRILEGAELAEALHDAAFEGLAYWRESYDSVAVAGVDTVAGNPCYKVVMKAKNGKLRAYFFDQKSKLLVKSQSVVTSPMGDIPVEAYVTDYQKIGDALRSMKTTMKVMGQDRIITVTGVEYNVDIPDSIFAIPDDIRELMKSK
jgi:hypothetical protein